MGCNKLTSVIVGGDVLSVNLYNISVKWLVIVACLMVGVAYMLCQSFNIKFNQYIKCVIEIVACLIDQMCSRYCWMFICWLCFCPSSII